MNILGSGIDAISLNLSIKNTRNFFENEIKNIQINLIDTGIYQPRNRNKFSDEGIKELVDSVREHGILQPVILRCTSSKRYELIAGERRLQAAIALGFQDVPAILKKIDAQQAFILALVENIQREELSILEEAEALLKLKNDFLMSTASVALMIGKPRTTISNLIRLASNLTSYGKDLLEKRKVEYGHIRCVLSLSHNIQDIVLNYVLERKLSVRATEKFVSDRAYEFLDKNDNQKKSKENILIAQQLDNLIKNCRNKSFDRISYKLINNGSFRVSMDFSDLESFKKILIE